MLCCSTTFTQYVLSWFLEHVSKHCDSLCPATTAVLQVLLQCPKLQTLSITGCSRLEVLMLWSDELTELDLTGQICKQPAYTQKHAATTTN